MSLRTERGSSNIANVPAFITTRATNITSTTLRLNARQTGTSMESALTHRIAGMSSLKNGTRWHVEPEEYMDVKLAAWYYQQTVLMRIRGFAAGFETSAEGQQRTST